LSNFFGKFRYWFFLNYVLNTRILEYSADYCTCFADAIQNCSVKHDPFPPDDLTTWDEPR